MANNMVAIKDGKKYVLLKTLAEKNNEFIGELITFYGSIKRETTEYGLMQRFGRNSVVNARDTEGKSLKAVSEEAIISYIKSLLADVSGSVQTVMYRISKAAILNRALNDIDPETKNYLSEGNRVIFKDKPEYMGLTYGEIAHKDEPKPADISDLHKQMAETCEAIQKATDAKQTVAARIKKLQKKLAENKKLLKKSEGDAYEARDKLCGLTHQYEELVKETFGTKHTKTAA